MTESEPRSPEKIVAMPLDEARRARGESMRALPRSKVATLRAFRRIRSDRVLGAIGLFLVIVAILLVFKWEKPPPVEKKYSVEFATNATSLPDWTDNVASRSTIEHTFTIDRPNVTRVLVWLEWKDDIGDEIGEGDTFRFTVTGPASTNILITTLPEMDNGTLWRVQRSIPVNEPPQNKQVPADSEAQARAAYTGNATQRGTGEWKIGVTLVKAGNNSRGPLGGQWRTDESRPCPDAPESPVESPCEPDPGNDFLFHFEYVTYVARYKPV